MSDMSILRTFLTTLGLNKGDQSKVIGIIDDTGSDIAKLKLGSIEGSEDEFIKKFTSELSKYVKKPIVTLLQKLLYLKGDLTVLEQAKKLFKDYPETIEIISNSSLNTVYAFLEANGYGELIIDFSIARGLDYYTGIVFEIDVVELGAQKQVCGGGRYDKLIREYGGHDTPATGFGLGFDRLTQCVELFKTSALPSSIQLTRSDVLVKMMVEDIATEIKIVNGLRSASLRVEVDLVSRSMKKLFAFASKVEIPFVIVIGKKELEANLITIKNLKTEEQVNISMNVEEIVKYIKKRMN